MAEQERISGGIALNFPANDDETTPSCSLTPPLKPPPRRLTRRLLSEPKSPLSAHDIESKLREADLRRQAKRQRSDCLRHRRVLNMSNPDVKLIDQQQHLSRILARYWRQFMKSTKTTCSLGKAFLSLGINEESVKSMPFEQLASLVKSPVTLKVMRALLNRLEYRLGVLQMVKGSQCGNIDHLLRLLTFPYGNGNSSGGTERMTTVDDEAQALTKLSRYPSRVFLCAYMITGHPYDVLDEKSENEKSLVESAANLVRVFELLLKVIIHGPVQISEVSITCGIPDKVTFKSQLEAYDKAWCSYLHHFVAWKLKDTKLLEEDLIRAYCQLELSLIQTERPTSGDMAHDMEALKNQVMEGQKLLRGKLQLISGSTRLERLDNALAELRCKFIEGKETRGIVNSSNIRAPPSSSSGPLGVLSVPSSKGSNFVAKGFLGSGGAIFSSDHSSSDRNAGSSSPENTTDNIVGPDSMLVSENELIVNEIIHGQHKRFADSLNDIDDGQNNIKEKVRETMEKAFWDGVMESIDQDEPDFSWVLKLMKEVRDELCEIAPQNWRPEIVENIDVDGLSQILKSGAVNVEYLRKSLEFALVILQKLSAPATEEEMRTSHNKLLRELEEISKSEENSSFCRLMIKGLRFVLQEIQALKREVSKARMKLVEPLIKGSAGLEYLKNAFANRYGPPADAPSSLTLTKQWLSSVHLSAEQEWNKYRDSLSTLASDLGSSQMIPTTLRTGGAIGTVSKITSAATGFEQPECKGDRIDLLVRLLLLKLVSGIKGLTLEALPETLKLNLSRLRTVQSQFQKIIVLSTSLLILRQMLVTEKLVTNTTDMENTISEWTKKLAEVIDNVEDVGLSTIVDTISEVLRSGNYSVDADKFRATQKILESMLGKSLQAEDAVFKRVSRCAYLALRGAVFGGNGSKGRELVVSALQRVGAAILADRVMEAAETLIVIAAVSVGVHGAWYEELLKCM